MITAPIPAHALPKPYVSAAALQREARKEATLTFLAGRLNRLAQKNDSSIKLYIDRTPSRVFQKVAIFGTEVPATHYKCLDQLPSRNHSSRAIKQPSLNHKPTDTPIVDAKSKASKKIVHFASEPTVHKYKYETGV